MPPPAQKPSFATIPRKGDNPIYITQMIWGYPRQRRRFSWTLTSANNFNDMIQHSKMLNALMIPVYCSSSLENTQIARWEILRWTRWISSCAYINMLIYNILQTWKKKHAESISYNLTPYTLILFIPCLMLYTLYHLQCLFLSGFFHLKLVTNPWHHPWHQKPTVSASASPTEVSMVRYNEQKSPTKLKSNSDFWEAGTISQKSTIYVVHFVDSDDVKKKSPRNGGRNGDSVCWKKSRK